MRAGLIAGFFYFLIVGTAGVAFGVLREMFLTPALGRSLAVFMELPCMLLLCWFGCRLMIRLVKVPEEILPRLAMGVLAFAGLIAMEQSLQMAMQFLTVGSIATAPWTLGDYFGLAGQVAYGLFPLFISEDTEPKIGKARATVSRKVRGRGPLSRQ